MLSLSQGNSILDAFLTAREGLIAQFKSPRSCEHCSVEFGSGHGGSTITFPPRSVRLIQLTPQRGWAALTQLHAVLGVWVAVEVERQCFHRLSTASSSFQGDATDSWYFACSQLNEAVICCLSPRSGAADQQIGCIFCSLKQGSESLPEFLRWEIVGAHWILCALREIASALVGREEQTAFWSRAQLHWKKLMMSSHLTPWARNHVGYWTIQNEAVKTKGGETVSWYSLVIIQSKA